MRNERGEKLDPTGREIHIPRIALGRIRVDQTKGLACLTEFPRCSLDSITSKTREPPSCIKLSADDLVSVWQGIALHEARQCKCNTLLEYSTASYLLRDMPGMKTGRPRTWPTGGKTAVKSFTCYYGLRPVEGAAEPRFQLVGRTIGLQPEEAPKEVTGRRGRKKQENRVSLWLTKPKRSLVEIQAIFPLV